MKEQADHLPAAVDHIRAETPVDSQAIDHVVRAAFGQDDEMRLVQALRDGGHNLLSLVAEKNGEIIGQLLFTRLPIEGDKQTWNAVALAPLAVLPQFQRQGVGTALMKAGLQRLRELGETIVIVLGHKHYYPRFGFVAELAKPLQGPFSGVSWMALELTPGALQGVRGRVKYADPFGC